MPDAIVVNNLGKRFKHYQYHLNRPYTIMETVLSGWKRLKPLEYFWAVRNVSFSVSPGKMVGVMGRNGAGKSTLLQLIGGVMCPDEGRVQINGRIHALFGLGSTFAAELTGRENTFLSGVVMGVTRKEVSQRFDSIVAFAELEESIDNPVRTYSSGMRVRLAFAIIIHSDPEVLLIDEALAVGDMVFKEKCLEWIVQFKSQGGAILLVSQSPQAIRKFADAAIWLHQGQIAAYGEPEVVAKEYMTEISPETVKTHVELIL